MRIDNTIYLKDYKNGACFNCNNCKASLSSNILKDAELLGICSVKNASVNLLEDGCENYI